jgi:hypothetical protein
VPPNSSTFWAEHLSPRVVDVVVKRVAGVGDLGRAVVALCRSEKLRVDPGPDSGIAVGQHRRPGLGAGAVALARARELLVEQIYRLLLRVEEDRSVLAPSRDDLY